MKKSVKAFEAERVLVSWCQSACVCVVVCVRECTWVCVRVCEHVIILEKVRDNI